MDGSQWVKLFRQVIDAQRKTVQRSQVDKRKLAMLLHLLLGGWLSLAPVMHAADRPAVLTGVIRDADGTGQMGALVQVLTVNSVMVGTALTDLHGRYVIPGLKPGRYLVRATAALFIPATRANLTLLTGSHAVVNLRLAALFDTASWLSTERRRADEPEDDWKWTLRSTASRPILRLAEQEDSLGLPGADEETEAGRRSGMHGRLAVDGGQGGFGEGGVRESLAIKRPLKEGGAVTLRAAFLSSGDSEAPGPDVGFAYEGKSRTGDASRTAVTYRSYPEILSGGVTGLDVIQVSSAQRMLLGDEVEVEVGGSVVAMHASQYAFKTYPFLRLNARLGGAWTLQYTMASDPALQEFEDVTDAGRGDPVAFMRNGRLQLEDRRHQQVAVARRTGRGTIEVMYYRDETGQTYLSGGEARPFNPQEVGSAAGGMFDERSGNFRLPAPGYRTNGIRVDVSAAVSRDMWIAAEYSAGNAVITRAARNAQLADALSELQVRSAQAMTVAIRGDMKRAGTQVRASYRWQPTETLTAVDPYSAFGDQPYLTLSAQQPVHLGKLLPPGLSATIDVTNLLAEGYRPFVSPDGQTLYFAQTPRTLQAGLAFNF